MSRSIDTEPRVEHFARTKDLIASLACFVALSMSVSACNGNPTSEQLEAQKACEQLAGPLPHDFDPNTDARVHVGDDEYACVDDDNGTGRPNVFLLRHH